MTIDDTRGRGGSRLVLAAGVLALGVLLGAVAFGLFFYQARERAETIQVVGSASERFRADIAKWRVTLARQVGDGELSSGYERIREDLDRFLARLEEAGVPRAAVSVQPVNAQPQWGPQGREGYNLVQGLYVVWESPEQLEALALNPGRLLGEGAALESSMLEYYYSGIAELKRTLLARATADARRRAAEIAGGATVPVASTDAETAEDTVESRDAEPPPARAEPGEPGRMISARAGVFQITEPYSTEVASYGIHSTSTRDKEISVTVHATFLAR